MLKDVLASVGRAQNAGLDVTDADKGGGWLLIGSFSFAVRHGRCSS